MLRCILNRLDNPIVIAHKLLLVPSHPRPLPCITPQASSHALFNLSVVSYGPEKPCATATRLWANANILIYILQSHNPRSLFEVMIENSQERSVLPPNPRFQVAKDFGVLVGNHCCNDCCLGLSACGSAFTPALLGVFISSFSQFSPSF